MEEKINITVDKGTSTINMIHSKGLDAVPPRSFVTTTSVTSAILALQHRFFHEQCTTANALVEIDVEARAVKCYESIVDVYAPIYYGNLAYTSDFKNVLDLIKSEHTPSELLSKLKKLKALFMVDGAFDAWIKLLRNWKARVTNEVDVKQNQRGTTTGNLSATVKADIPEKLTLECLMFTESLEHTFLNFDVCFEARNGDTVIWFENFGIPDIINATVDGIFERALLPLNNIFNVIRK